MKGLFHVSEFAQLRPLGSAQFRLTRFPLMFQATIRFKYSVYLQLVQTLEMLKLLGVNRVVIYKTSCSPEAQWILDYYTHKGKVEDVTAQH